MTKDDKILLLHLISRTGMYITTQDKSNVVSFITGYEIGAKTCDFSSLYKSFIADKFSRKKKFDYNLTVAKDFLLYKKVDDALWFDWDPIGINRVAPRDEYQSYVPEIFELVKAGADRQEIANRLHKLETENMGMNGTMENCMTIADKLLKAQ